MASEEAKKRYAVARLMGLLLEEGTCPDDFDVWYQTTLKGGPHDGQQVMVNLEDQVHLIPKIENIDKHDTMHVYTFAMVGSFTYHGSWKFEHIEQEEKKDGTRWLRFPDQHRLKLAEERSP